LLNRYVARVNPAGSKNFNPRWLSSFVSNIRVLPGLPKASLMEYDFWWLILFTSSVVCALCLLAGGWVKKSQQPLVRQIFGIVLLSITTFGVADFTYSLAGYGFTSIGLESRTLLSPSLSFSVGVFGLLACCFIRGNRALKAGLALSAFGVVTVMALAQHARVDEWAYVWQQERTILAAAPITKIKQLPIQSAVLYVGPSYYKGLAIFGAYWDITPAVFASKALSVNRKAFEGLTPIYPATDLYNWNWDGTYLTQDCPGYWTQRYPAAHLFVWNYLESRFDEVRSGYRRPPS
jgi:hypothetical protein